MKSTNSGGYTYPTITVSLLLQPFRRRPEVSYRSSLTVPRLPSRPNLWYTPWLTRNTKQHRPRNVDKTNVNKRIGRAKRNGPRSADLTLKMYLELPITERGRAAKWENVRIETRTCERRGIRNTRDSEFNDVLFFDYSFCNSRRDR